MNDSFRTMNTILYCRRCEFTTLILRKTISFNTALSLLGTCNQALLSARKCASAAPTWPFCTTIVLFAIMTVAFLFSFPVKVKWYVTANPSVRTLPEHKA